MSPYALGDVYRVAGNDRKGIDRGRTGRGEIARAKKARAIKRSPSPARETTRVSSVPPTLARRGRYRRQAGTSFGGARRLRWSHGARTTAKVVETSRAAVAPPKAPLPSSCDGSRK